MSKRQSSLDDFQERDTALKSFFGKIGAILKDKVRTHLSKLFLFSYQYNMLCLLTAVDNVSFQEYSICAWEVVRRQILYTLQFILQSSNYLI